MHIKIIYEPRNCKPGLSRSVILSCFIPFFYPPNCDRTDHQAVHQVHRRVVNSWERATNNKAILYAAL